MKRVLVVDDYVKRDSLFGKGVIKAGKKIKISFDFIETTEKAIEILKKENYDLVLMDGQFDNCWLQGPEAVAKIRKFSNIPIIMISGLKENNEKGMRKGANDYLGKGEILGDLSRKDGKIMKALSLGGKGKVVRCSVKTADDLRKQFLQIFLPLDIDMQTLALLYENSGDTESFLILMCSDGVDYLHKFEEFEEIVIKSGNTSFNNLYCRAGVRLFFSKLSKHADAESLLCHNWKIKGVKGFHDWYCLIASTLERG